GFAGLVIETTPGHVAPDAFARAGVTIGCGALLRWADECARCGGCDTTYILADLPEDPRICGSHAADHYGITTGLSDDGTGVFRRTNVAVPDHGNLDRLF